MPEHIKRLLVVIAVAMLLAVVAKEYFTADSFGVYGHYRADSVPDNAVRSLAYQGQQRCKQCHVERHNTWSQGRHQSVSCESCHGAANDHPLSGKLPLPSNTVRLCAACHEAKPARPGQHPQIVIREHAGEQSCIECHKPHSPLHFRWDEQQSLMQGLRNQLIATGALNDRL